MESSEAQSLSGSSGVFSVISVSNFGPHKETAAPEHMLWVVGNVAEGTVTPALVTLGCNKPVCSLGCSGKPDITKEESKM